MSSERPAQELARPVAETLKGGLARTKSALRSGCWSRRKRVGRLLAKLGLNTLYGEVHVGEAPSRGVRLLTEDGDIGASGRRGPAQIFRLDEHAAQPQAGS